MTLGSSKEAIVATSVKGLEAARRFREKNRDKVNAYMREFRKKRQDILNAQDRSYEVTCVGCGKVFRQKLLCGPRKKWCGDACIKRTYTASRKKENPRFRYEYFAEWRSKNRERLSRRTQMYRAKSRASGGSFTQEEWNALLKSTGHCCLRCGRSDVKLTVDHVVPVTLGGTGDIANIQPLCHSCNASKNNKIIDYRKSKNHG